MRQLMFVAPGRLEWTEAPDPPVDGDHGALIRPLAVARCDLDARMVADGLFPGPYPVGHEVAGRLGAGVERHDGPWPRRFDRAAITVSNTDDPAGLAAALRSTDDYGACTSTAIFFGPAPALPLLELYTKGITLHLARADSRRYLPAVLDLVTAGRLHPEVVTSALAGWADAAEAWLTPGIKLVLTRGDPQQRLRGAEPVSGVVSS